MAYPHVTLSLSLVAGPTILLIAGLSSCAQLVVTVRSHSNSSILRLSTFPFASDSHFLISTFRVAFPGAFIRYHGQIGASIHLRSPNRLQLLWSNRANF